MTECVSTIDLTREIVQVINVVLLPARVWRGSDIRAERNALESRKFLADSSRVELPAKEIGQERNSRLAFLGSGKKGGRSTRFSFEKS